MQPNEPYGAQAPQAGAPTVDARSKVATPATLIIVSQGIGLAIQLGSIAFKSQIYAALKGYVESAGKPFPEEAMHTNPVLAAIGLLGSCFVIFAMLEMRKLRRFPVAVTGAILAMLPVASLCCFFGFPLGIWALVVLFNA